MQEDLLVGGDVYDAIETAWGTRLLIGDVQGKGLSAVGCRLSAVGTAFAVIGAFREAAHRESDLRALVANMDSSVVLHNRYAEQTGEQERFVTALVISIDGGTEAQAVNCGHVPPYLLRGGAGTTLVLDVGLPLGFAALSDEPVAVGRFHFPDDSTLLLTTDGATEARAPDGSFHPLEQRLTEPAVSPAENAPGALYEDTRAFLGSAGQQDDVAILSVRRVAR